MLVPHGREGDGHRPGTLQPQRGPRQHGVPQPVAAAAVPPPHRVRGGCADGGRPLPARAGRAAGAAAEAAAVETVVVVQARVKVIS